MPPEMVFYDGHCGLCHGTVKFVMKRDRPRTPGEGPAFHFAPLDSEAFRAAVPADVRRGLPDSVIVQTRDGRLLARSASAVHLLWRLGGVWRVVGGLLWLIPRPVRDLGYILVARVRKYLFTRPSEACPMVPAELRARFHG